MRKIFLLLIILTIFSVSPLYSSELISIFANYNTPYNNQVLDNHIGVGGSFRFWGIFTANAIMYTEVIPGGDNIFNIQRFDPLGLFSVGFGMQIPLGDSFQIVGDWQPFYRGLGSAQGVYRFSDSWKMGLKVDLSDSFGIEVYKRTIYSFTDEAMNDPDTIFNTTPSEDGVELVGVGFLFYF